ncbi:hypothetical protein [Erythrobacter dokdonensis]|uniref:Uncharacterized protein n=1 Tax=Erythrobacter dokdonensis DSW-74 TaxID=1300349 RepID=A0A1A7BIU8_9SPHN|nr:hypothetical protein [Erythrobacter dokdonensis]OBV11372.1 hypothetical protein I603_0815 [Erythrobacter dokdonensis DSW-74]
MIDPAFTHVSEMLTLASSRHAEAIAAVQARPLDLPRVKAAQGALADAVLLVEDCLDLTGDPRLVSAMAELHQQQALLVQGIARLETAVATHPVPKSLWASPWSWISIAIIVGAVLTGSL